MSRTFLLASASPRRKELLAAAGYRFTVFLPDAIELTTPALTVRELVLNNALRKGRAALRARRDAAVLAADTLVALDGQIIGKPADLAQATAFLRRLSGRVHQVCTAVFVGECGKWRTIWETSFVEFHPLRDAAIARYFTRINPLDKAGAYAAQEPGGEIIARIEGSFSNVVGLPMEKTVPLLRAFGIEPA